MFFTMLLFELLPFCYVSFYSWDRKFFLADRVSGTYATSAYFTAHMLAGKPFNSVAPGSPLCTMTAALLPQRLLCDIALVNCRTGNCATPVYINCHELAGNPLNLLFLLHWHGPLMLKLQAPL